MPDLAAGWSTLKIDCTEAKTKGGNPGSCCRNPTVGQQLRRAELAGGGQVLNPFRSRADTMCCWSHEREEVRMMPKV